MINFDFLVEAELFSVSTSTKEKSVGIRFVDAENKAWVLRAEGVDEFYVSDFLLTNIVDRVLVFDKTPDCNNNLAENIFFMMRRQKLKAEDLLWPPLKQKLDAVLAGDLTLIEIQAVYGAEVLLLAKKFEVISDALN